MEYLAILIAWWLLSPIIRFFGNSPLLFFLCAGIGVFLYRRRRRAQARHASDSSLSSPDESTAISTCERVLVDLLILRNDLVRQHAEGTADPTFCDEIIQEIDTLCSQSLERLQITPRSQRWRNGRDAAWELLTRNSAGVSGPPPWHVATPEPAQLSLPLQPRSTNSSQAQEPYEKPLVFVPPSSMPAAVEMTALSADAAVLLDSAPPVTIPGPDSIFASTLATTSATDPASPDAAWAPAGPSVLERTLQNISGWPALLVPFLVQNILWFICGLCFVAGSTFLVSSTSGATNALAVSTVLLLYTLALLWGGYQLRRAKPELATSSAVLLSLGVLLIPLNLAATVRLIAAAQSLLWMSVGVFITAIEIGTFYYATMLVSGVMDRSLQGKHPRLYLALSALQIVVPILTWYPSWTLLAVTHYTLLGLLGYSLYYFVHDWLQAIFVEKRKAAYYAAGTLVYAAIVSFIHVAWGIPLAIELPPSYYSPFLMVTCGLLFYVDAQCKRWVKQHAALSRISFVIYGLSVLALLLCLNTPTAQFLTLSIAIGVYSIVAWQYTTLTPFSLLLMGIGWLYHSLFLHYLSPQWYFFASLPGLIGLLLTSRWLQTTRAAILSPTCYWAWLGTTLALTTWSLVHLHPSLIAMSSAFAASVLTFYGFTFVPLITCAADGTVVRTDLRATPYFYVAPLLAGISVLYAPQLEMTTWTIQTAFGLTVVAAFWTAHGLSLRHSSSSTQTVQGEFLLNSAVLNLGGALILAITLVFPHPMQYPLLPVLLALIGGVFLWISLALRVPWLIYAVLGIWGGAGTVFKLTYFPHHGPGTVEMGLALAVWGFLWWLEHESEEMASLRREQIAVRAQNRPPLTLFHQFPITENITYRDMLCTPLQQTMTVLWMIGMLNLGRRCAEGVFGWSWVLSAGLGTISAVLGVGYFRTLLLLPVAVLLGLGTCLVIAFQLGVSTPAGLGLIATLYAFLLWYLIATQLTQPTTARLAKVLHLRGNLTHIETYSHWTSVAIALFGVTAPLVLTDPFIPQPALFGTILSGVIFFGLAGWRYSKQFHSYLLLAVVILGVTLCYMWIAFLPTDANLYVLFRSSGLGVIVSSVSLTFWLMSWKLTKQQSHLRDGAIRRLHSLYHLPLCNMSLMLAVFAATQQLSLAWLDPAHPLTPLAISNLLLISLALFLTSSSLGSVAWQTAGLLLAALAVLWTASLLVHPTIVFNLWPGERATPDTWLTLALIAVSLASLAATLDQRKTEESRYARSLFLAATIVYLWALLGTSVLFLSDPLRSSTYVPLAFFTLAVGLFPLLQPVAEAARTRGVVLPLLAHALLVSTLPLLGLQQQLLFVTLLWGFTLWIGGNFVLPRWNDRHSRWPIAPDTWPWFGLLVVSTGVVSSLASPLLSYTMSQSSSLVLLHRAGYFMAGSVYCLLMLRNSTWGGFSWIGVFLLTPVGITLASAWLATPLDTSPSFISLLLNPPIAELLWLNLLLLIVPWWHVHGEHVSARLGWQQHNLPQPFLLLPAAYFLVRLLHLVLLLSNNRANSLFPASEVQWPAFSVFTIMLTFSFLHLWWQHRQTWEGHSAFVSLTCSALVMWLGYAPLSFSFPLFLALWSLTVCASYFLWEKQQWGGEHTEPLRDILSRWIEPSLIAVIVALVLVPAPIETQLLTLFILMSTAVLHGWQGRHRQWLIAAGVMMLVFVHVWPFLFVSASYVTFLLPWYALQLAIMSWPLFWLSKRLQPAIQPDSIATSATSAHDRYRIVTSLLDWAWPVTATFALCEWVLHSASLVFALATARQPQWLVGNSDVVAAMSTAGVLLAIGISRVWQTRQAAWTYGVALFAVLVGFYLRLVSIGLAPTSVWDTTAVLLSTYALFALYHVVRLEPLLHVVWTLPLLTVITVPFQLGSPHAGTTLTAIAALYLLTQRETERRLPLYLALLAFNATLYLWVPLWAEHHQVLHLYVVPISTSLLLLTHLHRHELKPPVLSAVRLAATTLLYVSAASDVFLRPGLGVFVVVLGISVAGVVIGIALRVRAFLYTGIASVVLNIGWQLLMLFPEQRFGQAVILLALAAVLAGVMVWFNAQRETILRRVRVFRTDLETWG